MIRRFGGARRIELRLICVKPGVLKILEERAVKGIRPRLRNGDHHAAAGPPVLRVVRVRQAP